ncbi:MAG: lysine--tRNA ligase [Nitrososphaerales archaeon]
MQIIGRGTWLDKVAAKLVEREKQLGRDVSLIKAESGLGASGIPHIGSLGDAVRAHGIKLALENIGYKSELIAYSDDMDGLRKVPEGLPVWLKDHLAKPVSMIPDPFSCHNSYGAHMSSMLLDALDKLDIKYKFQSGAEAYKNGLLVKQIDIILSNAKIIGEKIAGLVSQEKFKTTLPYFPICSNCKRIYVAEAYEYVKDEKKALYKCNGTKMGNDFVEGCGHEGEADIRTNSGKLGWKVEFAARWQAFSIRFEAYGKDIADSVKVNDWVSDEILKYPHPLHVRYEMFLDRSGKKISKSLGNVLTPQAWLLYGNPQSIMLLLFKRIVGTRNVGLDDIPKLLEEYDYMEDVYFDKVRIDNDLKRAKLRGIYEYINHLNPPEGPSQHVTYRLLVQLASVVRDQGSRLDYVINKLKSYGMVREKTDDLVGRIMLAGNWADDFGKFEKTEVDVSDAERKALSELMELIRKGSDVKVLQTSIFETARANGLEPKQFFKLLYNILIGADQGPRLGPYIIDIGKEKVLDTLTQYL